MTERQATLIRESWSRVQGEGEALARTFYDRLFQLDPRVRDLFAATEMESQPAKFMAMLGEVVRLLDEPAGFTSLLEASGRRHAGYGVLSSHYRTVGEALLWALEHAGAGSMDPETREAWAEAYTRMAFVMQRAGS